MDAKAEEEFETVREQVKDLATEIVRLNEEQTRDLPGPVQAYVLVSSIMLALEKSILAVRKIDPKMAGEFTDYALKILKDNAK